MPRARALALALLLSASVAGSGCLARDEGDASDEAVEPSGLAPTPGASVIVEVVDVTAQPVAGALVTLTRGNASADLRTDTLGTVHFRKLAAGDVVLSVQAPLHEPRLLGITVPATGEARHTVTLMPQVQDEAFVEVFEFTGFFECTATVLIVTGDCVVLARETARRAGVSMPENATNERFVFAFETFAGWDRIRITQIWDEPVAGVGTAMRLNLEPFTRNETDAHADRYARADGESPLVLELAPGVADTTASAASLVPPPEGGLLRTRTFHLGLAQVQDPGGAGLLGVGAAIQQEFTVIVEVFYDPGNATTGHHNDP